MLRTASSQEPRVHSQDRARTGDMDQEGPRQVQIGHLYVTHAHISQGGKSGIGPHAFLPAKSRRLSATALQMGVAKKPT
jgi:hypothetical protein